MLNEVTAANRYTANGATTAFNYTFKIFTKTDLEVSVDGVVKTVDTDYTVSGLGVSGGGTVTFTAAPGNNSIVTLLRQQAAAQSSDYIANEAFPAERIEQDLDKVVMQSQQTRETLKRTLRAQKQEALDMQLPPVSARKSKVLGFDTTGLPTAVDLTAGASGGDVSLSTVIATGSGTSRSLATRFADVFNVHDYGAKGDGVTDDTAAIQAAYAAASATQASIQPSGGSLIGTIVPVVFPSGHYKLSDTILPASAYSKTIGVGNPIIEQTVATKDIFDFAGGYIVDISGVSLVGGARQIRFGNNNLDSARLFMERIEFQRNNNAPMIQFYLTGGATNQSTIATLTRSKIILPYQAIETVAGVSMRVQDTWVYARNTGATPPSMVNGALFINKNEMIFDRVYGVPPGEGCATNARWVDNYGIFDAEFSRFGGEGGGMPIVYNFVGPATAFPYVSAASIVALRRCVIAMGPVTLSNRGILRAVTDFPQSLIVDGNTFAVHDSNDWITVDNTQIGGGSLAAYIGALNVNTRIYLSVKNNQGWVPLHEQGYPSALVNTDPTKVLFEFDHPSALVSVTYSATPTITPTKGQSFTVTPTNGNAFTWTLDSTLPAIWAGQIITLTIRNTFGVLGAISSGTGLKTTTWTAPANGFSRSKTLRYDGTNWVQIGETASDVPN